MVSTLNTVGLAPGAPTQQGGSSATAEMAVRTASVTRLLVVDDEPSIRSACKQVALSLGYQVDVAESVTEARQILEAQRADIVLLDLRMPGVGGMALLHEVHAQHPDVAIVVMTAFASVPSAVEAMRVGAVDYLTKPFALAELIQVLERAKERRQINTEARLLREKLKSSHGLGNMIGRSPEMEKLYRIIGKVAQSSHPVLILGESGTGKEVVARAIHNNGPTANKAFIPVDCGSLVPTLIESELFGYVKGAFTGAVKAKDGLLTMAEGGTVFLDEIGELPLDLQAKLLRALQEKEVRPVGATQTVPLKARILAATNRDLSLMVEQGRFRKDLYFRLNVVNLRIPPLRDRRSDIPALAAHFLDRMQRESGVQYTLSDESLKLLTTYDWPGNVRELENCIERACALSSGPVLHLGDMPTQLQDHHRQAQATSPSPVDLGALQDSPGIQTIVEMERQAILSTIDKLQGDKLLAAKLLGIGKTTLYRKLKEYGLGEPGDPLGTTPSRSPICNASHALARGAIAALARTPRSTSPKGQRAMPAKVENKPEAKEVPAATAAENATAAPDSASNAETRTTKYSDSRPVLVVSALASARKCAEEMTDALRCPVEVAESRKSALSAMRRAEYAAVIVDDAIAEADDESAEQLWNAAGLAVALQVNFAISNSARIIREIRAGMHRRHLEETRARKAAENNLQADIGSALTGIVLELDLLRNSDDVPLHFRDRLAQVSLLTTDLRKKLVPALPQRAVMDAALHTVKMGLRNNAARQSVGK